MVFVIIPSRPVIIPLHGFYHPFYSVHNLLVIITILGCVLYSLSICLFYTVYLFACFVQFIYLLVLYSLSICWFYTVYLFACFIQFIHLHEQAWLDALMARLFIPGNVQNVQMYICGGVSILCWPDSYGDMEPGS